MSFANGRHVAVAGGAGVGLAKDVHELAWRQDIEHQMGEEVIFPGCVRITNGYF